LNGLDLIPGTARKAPRAAISRLIKKARVFKGIVVSRQTLNEARPKGVMRISKPPASAISARLSVPSPKPAPAHGRLKQKRTSELNRSSGNLWSEAICPAVMFAIQRSTTFGVMER